MAGLGDLPVELLLQIVSHLELPSDINNLARTNLKLFSACSDLLYKKIQTRTPDKQGPTEDTKLLGEGPLEWAAEHGKHACVQRLLENGVKEWPSRDILAPIMAAAKRGDLDMVKTFVNHDPRTVEDLALWERHTEDGSIHRLGTALTYAIGNGHYSMVEFLIQNGARVCFPRARRDRPYPGPPYIQPLSQAISVCPNEHVARLIYENLRQQSNLPPPAELVHLAAKTSFEMFKMVSMDAALPSFETEDFWTGPLSDAIASGDARTVEFLFQQGVRPNMAGRIDWYPSFENGVSGEPHNIFTYIAYVPKKHRELSTFLLQQIDIDHVIYGKSLHSFFCVVTAAATIDDEELLYRLLSKANRTDMMPLISQGEWLKWLENLCLLPAVRLDHTGILNMCFDYGIPVSWENTPSRPETYTPIILAGALGKYSIVKILLERGGKPFHSCGGKEHFYADLLLTTLLGEHGQGLWDESQELLDQRQKILQLIMDRGFHGTETNRVLLPELAKRIFKACLETRHEGILTTLEEHGWLVLEHLEQVSNPRDSHWRQVLQRPNPVMIKRFLDKGYVSFSPVSADELEMMGETLGPNFYTAKPPLHYLGTFDDFSRTGTYSLDDFAAAMGLLLEYGADIEATPSVYGLSPLFYLVDTRGDNPDPMPIAPRVQVFLDNGASPFSPDDCEESLLEIAIGRRDIETVKVLLAFFDKQNVPFEKIRGIIENAGKSLDSLKMENVVWGWY